MGTVFHKKELLVLLQDFYCLTGLRAVVFDSFGMEVLSYPPELPAYCRLIRSVPNGKTGCYLCDQAACRKATRQKQTVIYPCHAGLIEVITRIQINDAVVGFLLLSHIVQGADEQGEWDYAQKCCGAYKVDADALREAYNALPRTPYPVLKSASDLLALAAAALYQKGLTRLAADSMQEKLSRYLGDYFRYVSEELPVLVRNILPISMAQEDNFICGLSYGGYLAWRVALTHPQTFSCAGSLSSPIDVLADIRDKHLGQYGYPLPEQVADTDRDLIHLVRKAVSEQTELPDLFQACGTEDFTWEYNTAARDAVRALGVKTAWVEFPGVHNFDFWNVAVRRFMDWLPLRGAPVEGKE